MLTTYGTFRREFKGHAKMGEINFPMHATAWRTIHCVSMYKKKCRRLCLDIYSYINVCMLQCMHFYSGIGLSDPEAAQLDTAVHHAASCRAYLHAYILL